MAHDEAYLLHLIENRTELDATTPALLDTFFPSIENTIEKKSTPSVLNGLDSSNPNRLIYKGMAANYHVLGGIRLEGDQLKISLTTIESTEGNKKSRLKLDLYEDKQVEKSAKEIAERLGLRGDIIEQDLHHLTDLLEIHRDKEIKESKETASKSVEKAVSPFEYQACQLFLKDKDLIKKLDAKLAQSGIVGEKMNRQMLFVVASSYKMPDPLHALIQGTSGSGKTHLLLKIAALMPQEAVITLTRVTDSSFYNYGEWDLVHKLVCLEDLDGLKEEAFLAFRELQSRGQLSSSTSIKDDKGNIRGMVRTVRGPIASLAATTKGDIYEDNISRCFLIAVDESGEQTEQIMAYQNQKSAGMVDKKAEQRAQIFLQNCVRLLQPLEVVNPFALHIRLPKEAHKIRRLNELYQSFIRQVTLIHQFQRQRDGQGRLISEAVDLRIATEILLESIILKVDELDGSLRGFYEQVKEYVKGKSNKDYEFTQREIRHALRVSKTQMQRYMGDLLHLEYFKQTSGHPNRGFQYKIQWWDNISLIRSQIKADLSRQINALSPPTPQKGALVTQTVRVTESVDTE